jgi:hypothetical protein
MSSREEIQSFIDRMVDGGMTSEELEEGLWVLSPEGDGGRVVVDYEPPVVVIRVNIMDLPSEDKKRSELMKRLLELNATELVHGSYGLEGSYVVLTDALQLENIDFNEFQASIDSITLALGRHLPTLASYRE